MRPHLLPAPRPGPHPRAPPPGPAPAPASSPRPLIRSPSQSPPLGPPPPRRPQPAPSPHALAGAAAEMAKAGRARRQSRRRGPYSSLLPPAPPTPGHAVTGAEAAAAAAAAAERGLHLAAQILQSCARGAQLRRGARSPGRRAQSHTRSEVGRTRLRGRAWERRWISGDSYAQSSLAGVQALLLCSAPRPGGRWTDALGADTSPRLEAGCGVESPVWGRGILRLGYCGDGVLQFVVVLRVSPNPLPCFFFSAQRCLLPATPCTSSALRWAPEAVASPTSENKRESFSESEAAAAGTGNVGVPSWGLL